MENRKNPGGSVKKKKGGFAKPKISRRNKKKMGA
jgi:hypothetical protein